MKTVRNAITFLLCAALCITSTAFVRPQKVEATTLGIDLSNGWTLIDAMSDEFNGNSLDTSKWDTHLWYDVSSQLAFKESNVSVRDGNLVLTAKKESYHGKAYTCGAVESKFEVPGTDSYVEVRAKVMNRSANVLSAIWLQASPLNATMNPNPEIDVLETFDFSQMNTAAHSWVQSGSGEQHYPHGGRDYSTGYSDISQDFHTYGVERSGDAVRFYFDGQFMGERTDLADSFYEMARHMVLSLEGHLGQPNDSYLPNEYLVDYIRTYYRSSFATQPVSGETYRLINRNSGLALSVPVNGGMQLIQSSEMNSDRTKWILEQNDDYTWTLENSATGNVIDLNGGKCFGDNAVEVLQYEYHGDSNQRWFLMPIGDGYYKITSLISGKAIVTLDASMANGAKIIQWSYGGSDTNDEWAFVPVEEPVVAYAPLSSNVVDHIEAGSTDYRPQCAAANAIDGNTSTLWHTSWSGCTASQRYITLVTGETITLSGYQYQPRLGNNSGDNNGRVGDYRIKVSLNGTDWTTIASGHWADNSTLKTVEFTPVAARYIRLEGVTTYGDGYPNKFMSAAEITLIGAE